MSIDCAGDVIQVLSVAGATARERRRAAQTKDNAAIDDCVRPTNRV